ncbi:START-like domain superfamily [Sesbania bispinosa]|nr:START-like domain superfamily [Sesbania bispinosa]
MSITFNLFDGEVSKNYKFLKISLQVIDKGDAGGVAIWTYDYEKLNEDIPPPYRYLDLITEGTKDIDVHLLKA